MLHRTLNTVGKELTHLRVLMTGAEMIRRREKHAKEKSSSHYISHWYISGFLMTGAEVIMGREEVRGPIAAVTSWVLMVGNMGTFTRLTILNLQAMSLLNTPDSSASTCPPT